MCGRFTLLTLGQFTDWFPWIRMPAMLPGSRYNIAPSQQIAVVANDGRDQIDFYRWGLVPFWAKDPAIGNKMINARMETLADKPAYRGALRSRRCLIPADGFYEWKKEKGGAESADAHSDEVGGAVRVCGVVGEVAEGGWGGAADLHHYYGGGE